MVTEWGEFCDMRRPLLLSRVVAISVMLAASIVGAQQTADSSFDARVARPAYARGQGPVVAIDEAHANVHTAGGRYEPFAALMANDGYRIQPGRSPFSRDTLRPSRILVIANAMAPSKPSPDGSAFTDAECDAVREWVRDGGSLLLISDHAPAGAAAAKLAARFDVAMGLGYVFDPNHTERPDTSTLIFSTENGLLGTHWIMRGRNASEVIRRVLTFAGQSLSVPAGATALLKLSPTAVEPRSSEHVSAVVNSIRNRTASPAGIPAAGAAQAVAMAFGKGRVVMFGEAALFSAQVLVEGGKESRFGMNSPGTDGRQLALNVMHWLSGLD
jgi:hypothetical protein